jgi:VanZ family protein
MPDLTRAARLALWVALPVTLYFALAPQPPDVGVSSDKVLHILAFLALTLLARLAYPTAPWQRLLVGLALFGALIELLQGVMGWGRQADIRDWLADVAAVILVLLLTARTRRWWMPR